MSFTFFNDIGLTQEKTGSKDESKPFLLYQDACGSAFKPGTREGKAVGKSRECDHHVFGLCRRLL